MTSDELEDGDWVDSAERERLDYALGPKKCPKWRGREARTHETLAEAAQYIPAKQDKTANKCVRRAKSGLSC